MLDGDPRPILRAEGRTGPGRTEDADRTPDRLVRRLASPLVCQKVSESTLPEDAAHGFCPRSHRVGDILVQRATGGSPPLDHSPQLRLDPPPVPGEELQLR